MPVSHSWNAYHEGGSRNISRVALVTIPKLLSLLRRAKNRSGYESCETLTAGVFTRTTSATTESQDHPKRCEENEIPLTHWLETPVIFRSKTTSENGFCDTISGIPGTGGGHVLWIKPAVNITKKSTTTNTDLYSLSVGTACSAEEEKRYEVLEAAF